MIARRDLTTISLQIPVDQGQLTNKDIATLKKYARENGRPLKSYVAEILQEKSTALQETKHEH
jgi:hypothetical protein